MKKYRIEKIQELIRREITLIIQKDLKDPRVQSFININEIQISPDLKFAKAYVSVFGSNKEKEALTFNTLVHATNFIKYKLSKNLKLRFVPELQFIFDDSVERGVRVIDKLDKLKKEREKNEI